MRLIFIVKPILLLAGLFLSLSLPKAQQMPKFITELRGGINLSEMDIDGANNYKKTKIGFNLGFGFAIRMQGPLYFQSGIDLTKKGLKRHDTSETREQVTNLVTRQDMNLTIDANYIQLPAMLGLEFRLSKLVSMNFYAGAYGAYGFKGQTKLKGGETQAFGSDAPIYVDKSVGDVKTFRSDGLKKIDYGAVGKIALVYDILSFNLGYEYGLCDVSNSTSKLKNRNTTFSLGVRF